MTLIELADQYRQSAAAIKERIGDLKFTLETENMCQMEKLRLRARIEKLSSIMHESNETALYLERYYDRRCPRRGRFAI